MGAAGEGRHRQRLDTGGPDGVATRGMKVNGGAQLTAVPQQNAFDRRVNPPPASFRQETFAVQSGGADGPVGTGWKCLFRRTALQDSKSSGPGSAFQTRRTVAYRQMLFNRPVVGKESLLTDGLNRAVSLRDSSENKKASHARPTVATNRNNTMAQTQSETHHRMMLKT